MMRRMGQEVVIQLSVTLSDVIYILHMLLDLVKWIVLLRGLINLIADIWRLLSSCIIGYFSPYFGIAVNEEGLAESLEHYDLLVLPPALLIDCKIAKSIVRVCKDLSKNRVKELMKSGHYVDAAVLYGDIEGLEILEVRELYHPRKLSRALRWCFLRRKLGSFKIGEINIYGMMVRNWRRLEEYTWIGKVGSI
jgi:hypothetical protein